MKSYKNRIALSLVLAGSVASCSAGINMSSLQDFYNSTEEETVQRREKMKKAAIISSATAAAILTVYLFDKYGMKKLGKDPLFSNKIDEVFSRVFAGMLGLCSMRKKEAAVVSEDTSDSSDNSVESKDSSDGSDKEAGLIPTKRIQEWFNKLEMSEVDGPGETTGF